jgi:hypothetical protein
VRRFEAVSTLVSVVIFACGDSGKSPRAFCEEHYKEFCSLFFSCRDVYRVGGTTATSEAECVTKLTATCGPIGECARSALVYRADNAALCTLELQGATCGSLALSCAVHQECLSLTDAPACAELCE